VVDEAERSLEPAMRAAAHAAMTRTASDRASSEGVGSDWGGSGQSAAAVS
jgi:hypothetical protein